MAQRLANLCKTTRTALVASALVFASLPGIAAGGPHDPDLSVLPSAVFRALEANGWKVVNYWPGIAPGNADAFERPFTTTETPTISKYPQGLGTYYRHWVITGDAQEPAVATND